MEDKETSLVLTGAYSGLKVAAAGFGESASIAARGGYKITAATTDKGLTYTLITIETEEEDAEPPSFVFTADYDQKVPVEELDLEVRYTDIPQGSEVEVACSDKRFDISRQPISGSSLVGSTATDVKPFEMSIEVRLWLPLGATLKSGTSLSLDISKIPGVEGGPVRKVLLRKLAVDLSA